MISKNLKYVLVFMIGMLFLAPTLIQAKGDKKDDKARLQKTTAQRSNTYFDINNISTWFYNNGWSDITPNGNSGLVYPKGSGKTAVFTAGLLWGAKVSPTSDPRVGGTAYRTGLVPGNVDANGNPPADNTIDLYRIYRVRPDVYPGGPTVDLSSDALNEGTTEAALRAAYELDWTEWPADMGAPYDNKDGVAGYDPTKDTPGVPGADQTLWFVTNDLDADQTIYLYNSNPLGIEMSETIWGYNRAGALGSMYFRKFTFKNITNRGSRTPTTFYDMYVSMWADIDLGEAGDDFIAVDTVLSLQYSYNANAVDAVYTPLPPPAVGFDFFQGPLVDGVAGQDVNRNGVDDAADYGIFQGQKVGPGKINLPMTAAYYFANGDPNIGDPPQGTSSTADGYRQFYNFFQGKFGKSGDPFIDYATGKVTTYALNGDPQAGTGWLDGLQLPAGDRRNGSASGPFTMAPGDIQEVVVAEIVGGAIPGTDRLSAIGILKFYDQSAQQAYDNFFDLPSSPPAPNVSVVELDQKIILDWGWDSGAVTATETNNAKGFKFQGYNVYQLPSASAQFAQGVRLVTYDKIDGVGKIEDKYFDASTGVVATKVVQFGNDYGIQRNFTITQDVIKGGVPLVNGIKYYFAVTSYNYNPSPTAVPNNLENPLAIITVVPHTLDPGVTQSADVALTTTHTGTANATVTVKVIDPTKLTGHDYAFFFNSQDYTNDANGNWTKVTAKPSNGLAPNDVSPSTMTMTAVYGDVAHTLEINANLTVNSPDYDYSDGVRLDFPAGVTINSAEAFSGCAGPTIAGQSILWGDSSRSKYGCFHSTATLVMNVTGTLPFDINYTIYDDAWASDYPTYFVKIADAKGTISLTTAASKMVTQKQWGVKDMTLGTNVIENQTVFGGIDTEFGNGPGGSSGVLGPNVGTDYMVQYDGLGFRVDAGSFAAPLTYNKITLNGTTVASNISIGDQNTFAGYNLSEFGVFGYPDGRASSSFDTYYTGAGGTSVVEELQKDYELRWTGVKETVTVGGLNVVRVASGGQMATLFGASLYNIKDDPANPNPGSSNPFLLRIPFEIWSIDDNRQVNICVWHRHGNLAEDPFQEWKEDGRMYAWIVNSAYDDTAPLDPAAQSTIDASTWNVVFFTSAYTQDDVVGLYYANPIQPGIDTYSFSTTKKVYSSTAAATDVEKINVFPNPYYGVNTEELNKYQKFVTFSHLPANAKIRIFNLAGIMVRTLDKVGGSQFMRWDLHNENNLPVASGIYIAYIDMPDIGTTKILKLAVIQEEQILDRF